MINFQQLIYPIPLLKFNQEYFEKKHLYISRKEDRSFYDELLTLQDVGNVLSDIQMRGDFDLRIANDNNVIAPNKFTSQTYTNTGSFKTLSLHSVFKLFSSGSTLILEQFNSRSKKWI